MIVERPPFGVELRLAFEGDRRRANRDPHKRAPVVEAAEIEAHLRLILKICRPLSASCERSSWPCSLQKWGTSMTEAGSLAMSFSVSPDLRLLRRLRAFSTGSGHKRPMQ